MQGLRQGEEIQQQYRQQRDDITENEHEPINRMNNHILKIPSSSSSKRNHALFIVSLMIIFYVIFVSWMLQQLCQLSQPNIIASMVASELNNRTVLPLPQVKDKENNQKIQQVLNKNMAEFQNTQLAKQLLQDAWNKKVSDSMVKKQKKHYQQLYDGIFMERNQNPMCLVATGRNNMVKGRQKRFLNSIELLNYSNYRLIYVDDNSVDETAQFTTSFIDNSSVLSGKGVVVRRERRYFALANKIKAIQQHCGTSDIILDVDSDDSFIGREALNVVNYLYSKNPHIWFLYTNHLISEKGTLQVGKCRGLNDSEFQDYRVSDVWVTSHLKTYRRQLFNKINKDEWKREDGQYYHWASDRFLIYPLIQLAGPKHTHFENVILYFYDYEAAGDFRNFEVIKPDKLKSQLLVPYLHLESLSDSPSKRSNYETPILIQQYHRRATIKFQQLSKRPGFEQ